MFLLHNPVFLYQRILDQILLQQIAFNNSSDIDFKDFMNCYKNVLQNPNFLITDAAHASDNPFYFKRSLLEIMWKLIMTIDDKTKDWKFQHDFNRKAANISALSSAKIDKYEYLIGEEILPSNRRLIIKQAKFAYSSLGKALEKQTEKQIGPIKSLDLSNKKDELKHIKGIFPKSMLNVLIIN